MITHSIKERFLKELQNDLELQTEAKRILGVDELEERIDALERKVRLL